LGSPFSFAKFLELLVYSPTISTLKSFLCDHTTPAATAATATPPGKDSPELSASRLNIVRHFSTASVDVSFALSTIEDVIFELKVPRLQIVRDTAEKASVLPPPPHTLSEDENRKNNKEGSEDEATWQRKELRREIKKWWEGVADHIDKIVREFFFSAFV
jgi:1-phosphatidylinositol-3-phosphate 5-kinase